MPKKKSRAGPPPKKRSSRLTYLAAFLPAAFFVGLIIFLLLQPPAAPPPSPTTATQTSPTRPANGGVEAPDFMLRRLTPEGLSSDTFTLSSARGKVVFLEFLWWRCSYCKAMAPTIKELHSEFSGRGVVFVTVMVDDRQSSVDESARFVSEHEISWTALWDEGGRVMSLYGVRGTPTYFVIDREGRVVEFFSGAQPKQSLSNALNSVLG
ncbi:MAG: TlpA disulfide reductase family protein [Nitrososphaerota archaeon]|nr:TlpA family protein disulfide reductase [Candidatus Calditenuaceae archaeon]MDW8073533.1 TlpA disulfide reductase family protein [Nitrososphaerota archaeon]